MDKISRNATIFIIALICFVGAIVTLFATWEQRAFYLRGYVNPTQTLDLPYRIPRLGVNVDLRQYTIDELPDHLDMMEAIGVTWVRQFISDADDFTQWDAIIALFAERPQLELVPVLVGTTTDLERFIPFVDDFATRYGDTITFYQIWDEPNIQTGWLGDNPNPTHYLALLQSAFTTIHQIDPQAHIISAALAPTIETGPQNISDHLYLRQLYQLGLKDYSDSIAGKPYGFDTNPFDRSIRADLLNFSRFIMLREVMTEYGDGQKALWASNSGWNSLTDDWTGDQSLWGQVSTAHQSQYTIEALQRADREWAWLGGFILDNWQADKQDTDNPRWGFSLLNQDDEKTPLYNALEAYHADQPLYAQNGLYPANNPDARYSGVWTFHELGADIGWVQDSQITFDFFGNSVSLITRQDDYVTNLYITVDGKPANQLPTDANNNAYLLLRSSQLTPEIINKPISDNLSTGNHRLHIVADELIPDEDIPRWSIIGYGVGNRDLYVPFDRQIVGAIIASFISFIAVIVSASQVNFSGVLAIWNRFSQIFHVSTAFFASIIVMLSLLITWHDGYPQFFKRESIQALLGIVTAGLVYWNGFHLPVAIVLLFFLLIVIYNNLKIGVLLIVFWSPFFLFPVELYRFAFPMVEIMLIITFGAWLLRVITDTAKDRQLPTIKSHPIDYVMLMFVLSGILGLFVAEIKHLAITDFRTFYLQPALFYVIGRTINKDKTFIYQMLFAFISSAVIVASIGIYQLLTGVFIQAEGGSIRLASVYGSPNNAALFLERCLPFVVAFILIGTGKRSIKIIAIVAGGLIAIALLLTMSAGALFIALPAGIVCLLLLIYGKRAFKYLIPIGIVFIIGFIFALQSPRFERFLDLTSGTNFYRVRVWQSAFNMVEDHPIGGIGLDQFLYKYRGEYILPDAWQEPELSHPHNIFFDFWLRSGIVGILFLLMSIGIITKTIRQTLSMAKKQYFVIIVGCATSLVMLMMHGLVDNSIFVIDLAYIFSLILILLTSVSPLKVDDTIHQGETLCEF
jgi:O-antigen ligase